MAVREIEEEYWTVQYLTNVTGTRLPVFWPLDGEGRFETEEAALSLVGLKLVNYGAARAVHVIRRMKYGDSITSLDQLGSLAS